MYVLVCQSEVELYLIGVIGEVFAQHTGCEAWAGGEGLCVFGFATGINDGTK